MELDLIDLPTLRPFSDGFPSLLYQIVNLLMAH